MVADPRAWNKLREFLLFWLKIDQGPGPGEEHAKVSRLSTRRSPRTCAPRLELFLENVVWSETSDYRELMLTRKLFLNGRLAKIYGEPALRGAVPAGDAGPGGALRRADTSYLLSSFAYLDTSSPIHRGVLIRAQPVGTHAPPATRRLRAARAGPDQI